MKKRFLILAMTMVLLAGFLTACSGSDEDSALNKEPDIMQIRSICELATLECYYHNVAKSTKAAGTGITHLGEKDREFWIEYSGIVKLGIDMSQVQMEIDGENVTITIPEAKVLNVSVDEKSYDENSYIMSQDSWNSNKITAGDATEAIENAKQEMEKTAEENSSLLANAQDRAKKLMENYIDQLGAASGVAYHISWKYADKNTAMGG